MNCKILWLTGLSGAGKSTIAKSLKKKIKKLKLKVKLIDGDHFRKKNKNKNSFTKKNIYLNNIKIINYISKIKNKYDIIIVSVISPLLKSRLKSKKTFGKNYIEIFVKCSLKELIRRDTKKLYKLAKEKKIKNLIGFNSKISYEKSKYKKLVVNTEINDLNYCIKKILKKVLY